MVSWGVVVWHSVECVAVNGVVTWPRWHEGADVVGDCEVGKMQRRWEGQMIW